MTDQRSKDFVIPCEVLVDLKLPLKKTASEEVLTQLSFRPPTVGEMKLITDRIEKAGEAAGGIFLVSLLNSDKLTGPDVERMNFIDMQLCIEALAPFLRLAPPTPPPAD